MPDDIASQALNVGGIARLGAGINQASNQGSKVLNN